MSVEPAISADGRHVAFISKASDLVHGDPSEETALGDLTRLFDAFVRTRYGPRW